MKVKRIVLFPYKMTSDGCKAVAANLTTMEVPNIQVFHDKDYVPKDGDYILGWGAGHIPGWWADTKKVSCRVFNTPEEVCRSIDKIRAFKAFKKEDVPTPKWTLEQSEAVKWSEDGKWICCRQSTEGMDGSGLILAKKKAEMVWAPLYTQYVPNDREFRAYVYDGEVIDVLEKKPDDDATDKYIRTESNHYIYLRQGANVAGLQAAAKGATAAIGLKFAGVDIVHGEDGKCYVLETNTAPGIGQITARRIAEAIRKDAGL